jgi:hypothetical protein
MSEANPSSDQRSKTQSNREMLQQRKRLIRRQSLLEKIATLASELCTAVDRESEDIGGSRQFLTILQELGPVCDALESWGTAPVREDEADLLRQRMRALQATCCGSGELCSGCRSLLEIANG